MENVSQGYGNQGDMMAPQGDAELAGSAPPEEQGGDIEGMIMEGVQAFMETQDPEIAVQVVMMLAETMGLGGGGEGGPQAAPDPMQGQGMPMAKHGGKFGFFTSNDRAGEFQKFVTR